MTTASPVRRATARLALVVALGALVASSTACNAGRPPAAVVEGEAIPASVVDEIVEAFPAGNPDLDIAGAGDDTYQTSWGTGILDFLVQRSIIKEVAVRRDVVVDDADRADATEQIPKALSVDSEDETSGQAVFDALSEDTQEWLVDLLAYGVALGADLTAEAEGDITAADARAYYDENPARFAQFCPTLLVVDPGDVDAVMARIEAGEDFVELSQEVSVEPDVAADPAGDCASGEQWGQARTQAASSGAPVEPYDDLLGAEDGDIIGPYAYSADGTVLIMQAGVTRPAYDDIADQVAQTAQADSNWRLARVLKQEADRVDVTVDPRFGWWNAEDLSVEPPPGATRLDVSGDLSGTAGG